MQWVRRKGDAKARDTVDPGPLTQVPDPTSVQWIQFRSSAEVRAGVTLGTPGRASEAEAPPGTRQEGPRALSPWGPTEP